LADILRTQERNSGRDKKKRSLTQEDFIEASHYIQSLFQFIPINRRPERLRELVEYDLVNSDASRSDLGKYPVDFGEDGFGGSSDPHVRIGFQMGDAVFITYRGDPVTLEHEEMHLMFHDFTGREVDAHVLRKRDFVRDVLNPAMVRIQAHRRDGRAGRMRTKAIDESL